MTEREKTFMKATLALLVIAVVLLIFRRRSVATTGNPEYVVEGSEFPLVTGAPNYYEMYYTTNPGISDNINSYFTSENNLTVNTASLTALSKQFIPMFGLVGMTAVSA